MKKRFAELGERVSVRDIDEFLQLHIRQKFSVPAGQLKKRVSHGFCAIHKFNSGNLVTYILTGKLLLTKLKKNQCE